MSNFNNIEKNLRPREKAKIQGINNLSDMELLALILQSGTKNVSVLLLSQKLIENFGSLNKIFLANLNDLKKIAGIGDATALKLCAVGEIISARNHSSQLTSVITSPQEAYHKLKYLENKIQEHLVILCLDQKSHLISNREIYIGTVNEITFNPREIFNHAIKEMAAAIILCHNHPSGDSTPSAEDISSTEKLVEISNLVGIKIIDHIIIGDNQFTSLREKYDIIF